MSATLRERVEKIDMIKRFCNPALGQWRDYSKRGNGNKAARRAARTRAAREHSEWSSEPIYQPTNMDLVRLVNRGYGLNLGVIGGAR